MLLDTTTKVLLGTSLLGLSSGIIGSFAVLRRRALLSDALAHAALPGICVAFLLSGQRSFLVLLTGAFLSGLLGVGVISVLRRHTRTKEDAAIGIVLSVFFGLGIALSRIIQNQPLRDGGSRAGLDNFIFGKTAGMLAEDVWVILVLLAFLLLVVTLLYKEFKLVSFDQEFAAVQGWPTQWLDLALMGLLALTTVVGLPAVGVVLMAALLIIPGAAARFWTERLGPMLVLSGVIGLLSGAGGTLAGMAVDWTWGLDLPAGPVIVLSAAALFLVSMVVSPRRGVLGRLWEHLKLARKVAEQNLLRTAYELSEVHCESDRCLPPPAPPRGRFTVPARARFGVEDLLERRAWSPSRARALVRKAVRRGLLAPDREGRFALTDAGLEKAAAVVRTHRLWELFLIEEAQIAPDHLDRDADAIEHLLPAGLVKRLEDQLRSAGRLPPVGIPPSPHVLKEEG